MSDVLMNKAEEIIQLLMQQNELLEKISEKKGCGCGSGKGKGHGHGGGCCQDEEESKGPCVDEDEGSCCGGGCH